MLNDIVLVKFLYVQYIQVENELGNWSCDGELINGSEIQVRVHRQALNLFASGIQFEKLVEYNPIKTNPKKKTLMS